MSYLLAGLLFEDIVFMTLFCIAVEPYTTSSQCLFCR